MLTIQHKTHVDEIFNCTIFEEYGGMTFFTSVPPYSFKILQLHYITSNSRVAPVVKGVKLVQTPPEITPASGIMVPPPVNK